MRFRKQKRHRKIVRFYMACFGFREPFKVLCDGTFVHHLRGNLIIPADTALANVLGAAVKIFTTSCVLAELQSLGDSDNESLSAVRNLTTARSMMKLFRCDHETRKSAVACITEIIGENNPEHFFVATQDADLRKKLQEIPGVPVLFALRNALFLKSPSTFQYQHAKSAEEERSHMSELEYKVLRKKNGLHNEEAGDSSGASLGVDHQNLNIVSVNETRTPRRRTDVEDKVQFKRKKAKGPNPLSFKKRKMHGNPDLISEKKNRDDGKTMRSRSRKRKRSHKGKNLAEITG